MPVSQVPHAPLVPKRFPLEAEPAHSSGSAAKRQRHRSSTDLNSALRPERASVFSLLTLRRDALAGTISGLIAVPLSVGICLMSEFPIQTGLLTVVFACCVGFVTSLFRPGNYVGVPGVAAGLAPVLALCVHKFGMANMPFLIFLTSMAQVVAWKYNLQRYILRAIPPYLIEGLLAGIGLKIALKFFPYTYGVVSESGEWMSTERIQIIALSLGALILFMHLFAKYKTTYPAIPYIFVIAVGILSGIYLDLPMLHIEPTAIHVALPLPDFSTLPAPLLLELFGYAMMLALIDVIEQVTSNAAITKLDPLRRPTNTNNSLLAIWIANLGSSCFGGMTNLDGLAKSTTNALAGAMTKVSNLFTAMVLAIFLVDPHLLEHLPYFSLAVLMIFTGWKMIAGLVHVASHGQYALLLALFCGILTYVVGIFEGLLVVLALHVFIHFVIFRHDHVPMLKILKTFVQRFSDHTDSRTTSTMLVHKDEDVGGLRFSSINRAPADRKQLTDFLHDWAFGVNTHSIPAVVSCYDYSGLLWGTFAKELREGHIKIRGYFEHLFELEGVHVLFETAEVRNYNDIYIQSGKYVFSFQRKKERITVPARYSFVCKKEKTSWYILEHHSSEFPA